MGERALQPSTLFKTKGNNSTLESFEKTLTDELIIGICSPIGSLKEKVLES